MSLEDLLEVSPGAAAHRQVGVDGGGQGHLVAPDGGGGVGDVLHREFPAQEVGAGAVADEEELVAQPGEVPGEGEGPDRVAVAGAVDAVENLGHMVSECKPAGARGQSPAGDQGGSRQPQTLCPQ